MTADAAQLRRASLIIVAVPTPVDKAKRPDLTPLVEASRLIAKQLTRGNHRRLRVDGLSGLHRRDLRSGSGTRVQPQSGAAISKSVIRRNASTPATPSILLKTS